MRDIPEARQLFCQQCSRHDPRSVDLPSDREHG